MPATLTVAYPVGDGLTFDYDYYASTHMGIVSSHMGEHVQSHTASKGLAGGPGVPSPVFAVFHAVFADMDALQAALGAAGPVLADIPNYYNGQPSMTIGETL
jgi:uncharacterized protein (TIGR02118 family)